MTEERLNGSHYAIDYNGDGSSLTNLTRANIAADTINSVVINDGAGLMSAVATLGVPNGGTGQTSFTLNNIIVGNSTTNLLDSGVNVTTVLTTINSVSVFNKDMTDNSNNVIARELWVNSGAGSVSTYAAAVPSVGQVLTATSATTATWQAAGASVAKSIITLNAAPIYAKLFMQWESSSWFAWLDSEYGSYSTGKIVLNPELLGTNVNVRVYNATAATVLGSAALTVDGPQDFSFTLPVADAKLDFQVQKATNNNLLPIIYGVTLVLTP